MIEYDPKGWASHLTDIRGSMAREIFSRVLTCGVFSAVVVACHRHVYPVEVPLAAHSLIGLALGLLLVFRTNASYDRYWEGRRLWGSIINESRNLIRGAWAITPGAPAFHEELAAWAAAFPYAVMHHLRGSASIGPAAGRLPAGLVAPTLASGHVPIAVACRISETLRSAWRDGLLTEFGFLELDRNVQQLVDYTGGCERIRRTPLPFVYVAHLRRALILYCFTLPLALVGSYGWATIGVVMLLSYILLGIEEIGVEIENPFGKDVNDLPLEGFCATVERDLAALLALPHADGGSG